MTVKHDPSTSSAMQSSATDTLRRNRRLLRELLEYRNGRRRVGEIVLRVRRLRREAHLITLADGEHLLIFVADNALSHWAAARDPVARLHREICSWLTERPWHIER
jgi:hypothetical protein